MVACAEGALWEEALEILGEMVRKQLLDRKEPRYCGEATLPWPKQQEIT